MTIMAQDINGHQIPALGLGTVQKAAYTATAGTVANAVGPQTKAVTVWCSTDAHIAINGDPTATTDDAPLTAKQAWTLKVRPGVDKVSAIQQSAGGTLWVVEHS
jgi:hypothetical protein